MKNQTKTFTKKTELVFTTIEIRKNTVNKYYASFEYGKSENNLVKAELSYFSFKKLINEISTMLDCEIDERHYIIKYTQS